MDDVGLHLAEQDNGFARRVGRMLLHAMPRLLTLLTAVGTVAMLWVGGGIILHGLEEVGLQAPADWAHGVQHAVEHVAGTLSGVLGWLSYAAVSALFGLVLGGIIAFILHHVLKLGASNEGH